MNQGYANCYQSLLARATKYKNRKKPVVYQRYYSNLRLCPTDPSVVEIGQQFKLDWWDRTKNKFQLIADEDNPFVVYVRLDPTGMSIFPRRGLEPEILNPLAEKYPELGVKHLAFEWRQEVDISFNNMLFTLTPMIRHVGTHDAFPGLYWGFVNSKYDYPSEEKGRIKAAGPIRYDAINHQLLPLSDVPQRIVDDDKRKEINARLRTAYKQLRALQVMGVEITLDDFKAFYGPEDFNATLPIKDKVTNWADAEALLAFLDQLDTTNRNQVVEAHVRMGALLRLSKYHWFSYSSAEQMRYLHREVATFDKNTLARVRKALHKALEVVRYET